MMEKLVINQLGFKNLGLEDAFDVIDASILQYIQGRILEGEMSRHSGVYYDGVNYYNVKHAEIIVALPMIKINSISGVKRRIKRLVNMGFLVLHPDCRELGASYYALGELSIQLLGGKL